MKKIAVCVVGDFKFLHKYLKNFLSELRNNGNFNDDVIVITSFLTPKFYFKWITKDKKLIFLKRKKIKFSNETHHSLQNLNTHNQPNRHIHKPYQWQKLFVFDYELKKWDFILYIDINMHIHYPLNKLLSIYPEGKFTARTDGYPDYVHDLQSQFDESHELNNYLTEKYNLNTKYYFQTGVMYFDTNLISKNTISEILSLVEEFPISKTNEQGILNLYFLYKNPIFQELILEIDDFLVYYYWLVRNKKIIITKQLREKYK